MQGELKLDIIERFANKYDSSSEDVCWLWETSMGHNGYGLFYFNGHTGLAHRVSYEIYHGAIPKGLVIDHLCRTRNCVNPNHLEPVTQEENIRRGENQKYWKSITHCKRGHALSGDNIKLRKRLIGKREYTSRVCMACRA